ncbi:poly(A) polymerase [Elusimicrobium simillimum]|uniref:CCA tRNA nucleotidyltransferase n=1 Tax=Elusimicrobium simillimum TaxID=3143438 RepID=UPI003C6ED7E6
MNNIAKIIAQVITDGYYVGGCVRDALLKRQSGDIDIALPKEAVKPAALALAKKLKAAAFEMDAEFGVWRVITRKENLQIDLTAYQGKTFEDDLKRRDFTVNALAYPVQKPLDIKVIVKDGRTSVKITKLKPAELVDIVKGVKDLKAKTIRSNSESVFKDDPIRTLRAVRTAAELNFKIAPATALQIKKHAKLITKSAGERTREELVRIFNCADSFKYIELMDKLGLLTALFPLLEDQRKCAEVYYGKGGVFKHTMQVVRRMEELLNNPKIIFPKYYKKLQPFLEHPSIYKVTALLHDIAKPATAKMVDGRLRFFFHEEIGARMAEDILKNLRYSTADIRLISAMIREHLRPSNLASNDILTDRGIYKFFRDMGDAGVPMLMLCWADYASYVTDKELAKILPLTTKRVMTIDESKDHGNVSKTLRHMQVLNFMLKKYFEQAPKINPPKIIDGKEIMKALELKPGPLVGELLEAVAIAQVEGKVKTKADAIAFLKNQGVTTK